MQRGGSVEVGAKAVEAWYLLQELTFVDTAPLALKAVLGMHIPDMMSRSGPLTAAEIAGRLPRRSHDAAQKLERILRLLAHKRFFTSACGESGDDQYGLTDLSRYFVSGSEFDMSAYAVLFQWPELPDSMKYLQETVEEDANGFELANGASLWSYSSANPGFGDVFIAAMKSGSKLQYEVLARRYEGFRDVKCLVDVGGGVGRGLGEIVRAHPHIAGKNIDLPHVIAAAPQIPGERDRCFAN
jgi:caffeic acid 3-O-methyltransferase